MCTGSGAFQKDPTAPMPSPDEVSIASGPLSARFRPEWGGRMTHLTHAEWGDILVPTHEDRFEPDSWPRAGGYPLVPYHNRIYNSRFAHAGAWYSLCPHPALAPDAIHGPAHRRPWSVAAQANDRVLLQLDYDADDEWPFSFRAEQQFLLEPNQLVVELAITNLSGRTAPVGIGWHPYIAAPLHSPAETDGKFEYQLDDLNVPTSHLPQPRSEVIIPATSGYTLHFADWTRANVRLDKASLLLKADPVFGHLAVHRMENYLCIEPVSMAAGVLALSERNRTDRGLRILPHGGCLSGRITLSIKPNGDETPLTLGAAMWRM